MHMCGVIWIIAHRATQNALHSAGGPARPSPRSSTRIFAPRASAISTTHAGRELCAGGIDTAARTLVAFIPRRFAGSIPVSKVGPILVSAEAGGTDGPSTGPFRSCVQGNAGPSSGPYEARRLGLGVCPRFGSQTRTQAARGFALGALSQLSTDCRILQHLKRQRRQAKCLSALVFCW